MTSPNLHILLTWDFFSQETGAISPVMNRFMTIDLDGNGVIDGNETMIMFKEEHTNKGKYIYLYSHVYNM